MEMDYSPVMTDPRVHHCFVSALDVAEQLPFSLDEKNKLDEDLVARKKSLEELEKFIILLRKHMGEYIYHLGRDTINKRSYHRFMFHGPGFLEIILEAPVAINAHFQSKQRAKKFLAALKKTLRQILPPGPKLEMFLASIELEDEHHVPLQIEAWEKIRNIRSVLQHSAHLVAVSVVIFTLLEFGEEAATEFFRETFGINAVMITIIISVFVALLLRPLKNAIDHVVENFIFRK